MSLPPNHIMEGGSFNSQVIDNKSRHLRTTLVRHGGGIDAVNGLRAEEGRGVSGYAAGERASACGVGGVALLPAPQERTCHVPQVGVGAQSLPVATRR